MDKNIIKKILININSRIVLFYKLFIKHDSFTITVRRWFRDDGDSTLRIAYSLTQNSIVFDVGGYLGEWSQKIIERYDPYVFIFEPVPKFYSLIKAKFEQNPKVSVYNFGLSDRDKNAKISINNDSSSIYR